MDLYEKFQELLDTHPSRAPKSRAFTEILKILFAPDDVSLALHMSFRNKSLEEIAKAASLPVPEAERLLEAMADRAVIYARAKDGKKYYALLPTIPGLFEFPFMKGGGTPDTERLAKLWEEYYREVFGDAHEGKPTPLQRVVPVEKSFAPQTTVHPHEEVRQFIESARFIALTNCACRVSMARCDKPKDVCMVFDAPAQFLAERGYAWQVSPAEAVRVLDRAEEAGLVHTSNNSRDRATLICNCCSCCCIALRGRAQHHHPHAFSPSRFEARVKGAECTGCGICVDERCPMAAIELRDGIAVVAAEKCIGCGLCVTGCPAKAIDLLQRAVVPEVPATVQEMGLKIVQEKGTIDDFVKVMQR
jgi:electron transport complex protein RnfB